MKLSKVLFGYLVLCPVAISIYSIAIEPNWLEVTHYVHPIVGKKLGIKVAHVTDLHSDNFGRLEKSLLNVLESEQPDLIAITGDLVTPGGTQKGYGELLKSFKAPLGVYFVPGNWEAWEPVEDLSGVLKESGVVDLTNRSQQVSKNLWLVGFDDEPTGDPDLSILDKLPPRDKVFRLGLFHSPVFYDKVASDIDLALAGHSHGGQVRFPIFGSFWLPQGVGDYISGWFSKNGSKLYVGRGLGNSIFPVRFNCRPELTFFEL